LIYIIISALFLSYIFIVIKRGKKYKYDTSKDYIYDLDKNLLKSFNLKEQNFILTNEFLDYDTLFMKVKLSKNLSSLLFKPYFEISGVKHFVEYAAKGTRYINISHLKEKNNSINLHHISLESFDVEIFGYKNNITKNKKVLILAPHADDAEIAAFGFYKEMDNVTIVTTTAGEHGFCNYCNIFSDDKTKQAIKKGKLRAYDAMTVPLLGGVPVHKSITLGYFGGSLEWMSKNKDLEASSVVDGVNDMNIFRNVSHSDIKLQKSVKVNYESFLNDIGLILESIKPDIIVTSHPEIDSHTDHKYTTSALLESMKNINFEAKLLLYTNHLTLSETYPLGEIYSAITLPPNKKDFYFDSVYSFNLDKDSQIDKFFALEAIHDLRDSEIFLYIKSAYKYLNKVIKRKIIGKDKSYYKRAIRDNELFFVVEKENLTNIS